MGCVGSPGAEGERGGGRERERGRTGERENLVFRRNGGGRVWEGRTDKARDGYSIL